MLSGWQVARTKISSGGWYLDITPDSPVSFSRKCKAIRRENFKLGLGSKRVKLKTSTNYQGKYPVTWSLQYYCLTKKIQNVKKIDKNKWIFISLLKSTKSIDMMFDVGNGCRMDFAKFQVLPDHI